MDTLGAVVALGHHVHLHLSGAHAVALADHVAEGTIAAVARVGRHEEVTEVDGLGDVTREEVHRIDEVAHLGDRVGDEDGLEVVPEVHPMADPRGYGVDVLEHCGVLDADDVAADGAVDVLVTKELLAQHLGLAEVEAAHREVGHPILGDLLSVAGASDDGDLPGLQLLVLLQVVRDEDVLLGDHALDRVDDELGADDRVTYPLEVIADVGRGGREDHRITGTEEVIDVRVGEEGNP